MFVWLEKFVYGLHYVVSIILISMPITNIIAIWFRPLRVFNLGFFIAISVLQAIYWPVCPLTHWHNKLLAITHPSTPPSESFIKNLLARINIRITFKQVVIGQLIVLSLSIATFLLWLF